MKNIFIVTFLLFSVLKADFIRDDKKEVVSDTTTCLMWQDDIATTTSFATWQEAIEYCDSLNFAGFTDWRLPNINELNSISDRTKSHPAIKDIFNNIDSFSDVDIPLAWPYLSSTSQNNSTAWGIDFTQGYVSRIDKTSGGEVRCVRSGQ